NSGIGPLRKEFPPQHTRGLFYQQSSVRFRDIIDGLSNTVGISELIKPPRADFRGVWTYPEGTHYEHALNPNSGIDEVRTNFCDNSDPQAPCTGTYSSD